MEARSSAAETQGSPDPQESELAKLREDAEYAAERLDRLGPWWLTVDPFEIDMGCANRNVLAVVASSRLGRPVDLDEARCALGIPAYRPKGIVLRGGPLDPRMPKFNMVWSNLVLARAQASVPQAKHHPVPHPLRHGPRARASA